MKTYILFLILFSLLLLLLPLLAAAQPNFPGNPSQAPIDGGLGALAVLGGSYAIKKLRDKRRE